MTDKQLEIAERLAMAYIEEQRNSGVGPVYKLSVDEAFRKMCELVREEAEGGQSE